MIAKHFNKLHENNLMGNKVQTNRCMDTGGYIIILNSYHVLWYKKIGT